MSNGTLLITHAGTFHADDVLSTVFLIRCFDAKIPHVLRVGVVPKNIPEDSIVYDIGHGLYDHHQKNPSTRDNGIIYSAFGLLWKDFGMKYLEKMRIQKPEAVFSLFDKIFVQAIDAHDNGQVVDGLSNGATDVIAKCNPQWNEEDQTDGKFYEALRIADTIFENELRVAVSKAMAKEQVLEALSVANAEGKTYMIMPTRAPWKTFIIQNADAENILYVIYPSARDDGYMVQAVPKVATVFENKKPLPENWWGLKGEALVNEAGIPGLTFCHPNGFVGGAETLESAIAMAEMAS